MSKHTPGPWSIAPSESYRVYLINDSSGHAVGEVVYADVRNPADAHLIAAAPDLLRALENADKLIEQLLPGVRHIVLQDYAFLNETCMANTAAIRLAKGVKK